VEPAGRIFALDLGDGGDDRAAHILAGAFGAIVGESGSAFLVEAANEGLEDRRALRGELGEGLGIALDAGVRSVAVEFCEATVVASRGCVVKNGEAGLGCAGASSQARSSSGPRSASVTVPRSAANTSAGMSSWG
jgi:hypothetical protein